MMRALAISGVIAASALLGACNNTERALGGAAIGGTAGAVIGGLATDSVGGAIVGGVIGAAAGGAIGEATGPRARYRCVRVNRFGECTRAVRIR
jgi:predicted small secreted protein